MKKGILIIGLFIYALDLSGQDKVIDSLQRIVSLQRQDTTEINALLLLSDEYMRKDLNKVKSFAHQALVLSQARQAIPQEGHAYFYLVSSHQNRGNPDSALFYLNLLGKHAEANPKYWKITANYNQAAGLFYKNSGQPKKALPYLIKNVSLVKQGSENQAGLFLNIGNTYNGLSEYKNAASYHLRALTLFEKLNSKRGESFCLQSLGNDFLGLKQFEKAKEYFMRSL